MLAYTEIKAPFNGVVTQRNVDTGHYVHPITGGATEPLLIVAQTEQGRGILGVIDGFSPKGIEDEAGITWRKDFLRMIGYKIK